MDSNNVLIFVSNLIEKIQLKRDLIFQSIDSKVGNIARKDIKSQINCLISVISDEKTNYEQSMGFTPTFANNSSQIILSGNNEDLDTNDNSIHDITDGQIITDFKLIESKFEDRFNRLENMIKNVIKNTKNEINIKKNFTSKQQKQCFICQKFGHISVKCWKNPKNRRHFGQKSQQNVQNSQRFNGTYANNREGSQRVIPQMSHQFQSFPKNFIWDPMLYNSPNRYVDPIPPFPQYPPYQQYRTHWTYGMNGPTTSY